MDLLNNSENTNEKIQDKQKYKNNKMLLNPNISKFLKTNVSASARFNGIKT